MSLDLGLTLLGVAIVVLGGGAFAIKTIKKRTQAQSVKDGSVGIQSGRDTKIGQ